MQGKQDYSGLCNVGECMIEDLRRAGDHAFAGGMSQLVEAVKDQAARLAICEAALREIASIWNERHEAKIAEYVGAGTEAFEDVAYVDALALQLPCAIARKALETK